MREFIDPTVPRGNNRYRVLYHPLFSFKTLEYSVKGSRTSRIDIGRYTSRVGEDETPCDACLALSNSREIYKSDIKRMRVREKKKRKTRTKEDSFPRAPRSRVARQGNFYNRKRKKETKKKKEKEEKTKKISSGTS